MNTIYFVVKLVIIILDWLTVTILPVSKKSRETFLRKGAGIPSYSYEG